MTYPAEKETQEERSTTTLAMRSNDALLQQVHRDRLQRRERAEQLAAFKELVEDNHSLQTATLSYQEQGHLATNILDRTLEALYTVRAALKHCAKEGETVDINDPGQNTGCSASGGWV